MEENFSMDAVKATRGGVMPEELLTESEKKEAINIAGQIESLFARVDQEKRTRILFAFNALFSDLGKDLRDRTSELWGE